MSNRIQIAIPKSKGDTVVGYNTSFTIFDWLLNGDYWELMINHNLNSSRTLLEIRESNSVVCVDDIITVDANSVKLSVPADPDLRFDGNVALDTS